MDFNYELNFIYGLTFLYGLFSIYGLILLNLFSLLMYNAHSMHFSIS